MVRIQEWACTRIRAAIYPRNFQNWESDEDHRREDLPEILGNRETRFQGWGPLGNNGSGFLGT